MLQGREAILPTLAPALALSYEGTYLDELTEKLSIIWTLAKKKITTHNKNKRSITLKVSFKPGDCAFLCMPPWKAMKISTPK